MRTRTNDFLPLRLVLLAALGACGSGPSSGTAGEAAILASRCGGFAGTSCPAGYVCVGSNLAADGLGACRHACAPGDACGGGAVCEPQDPTCTDATCSHACTPPSCGGALGRPCAGSLECIDDGTDGCEPGSGADCPGVCAQP